MTAQHVRGVGKLICLILSIMAHELQVEGRTGEYWVDSKPSKSSKASQDKEAAKRLWDISVELTGADFKFPLS